jgi:DNA-binding transcriptional LysR family regulator
MVIIPENGTLPSFPRSSVINFHRLRIFHAVVRHLSFSQAAEEFNTSQPNVSRQIAKLEAELGASLFHRLGGRIALTDAGRTVYDHAQRVFEQIENMQRALHELQGLEGGYLRLAASSTPGLYLLPPQVATFQKEYPSLEISLCLTDTQEVVDLVLGNQVDLGYVEAPVMTPKLQVQPYFSDEIVPIASPENPLTALSNVKPEDLDEETLILQEQGSGTRQVVESALAHWGLKPQRVLVIRSFEGIKKTVAAGLGISFVSRHAMP